MTHNDHLATSLLAAWERGEKLTPDQRLLVGILRSMAPEGVVCTRRPRVEVWRAPEGARPAPLKK